MNYSRTVLAIDTSHNYSSISIIRSDIIFAEISILKEEQPSDNIIDLVEQALLKADIDLKDLNCIAVGVGPGNFTGIRVGISVAKGLALALNISCLGVNRFETLLINKLPTLSIIKIKKDLYYTQIFNNRKPISDPIEENLSGILSKKYSSDTIISGDNSLMISQTLNLVCGKKSSISNATEIGFIALNYPNSYNLPPSPVYVKVPDAKLPTEPPPRILYSNE